MTSLTTRMLVVFVCICFSGGDDSLDTETRNNMDVLRDKNIAPAAILAVVLPATLVVVITYQYWRL